MGSWRPRPLTFIGLQGSCPEAVIRRLVRAGENDGCDLVPNPSALITGFPEGAADEAAPDQDFSAGMIPTVTEYVEVARAESERGEVVLRRRIEERSADTLELRVNGVFVMDTRETGSEIELAAAALELVDEPRRVVVGGLGLGFTVQRVLADHRVEEVRVVEIEEALIRWMRDGTISHGPALLADNRLHLVEADIVTAIEEATSAYDLVLLDVDNGPGYLVHERNAGVYQHQFIERTRQVLTTGGALVVWSASAAPELVQVMKQVFGNCTEHHYEVLLHERPEEYLLYLSRHEG